MMHRKEPRYPALLATYSEAPTARAVRLSAQFHPLRTTLQVAVLAERRTVDAQLAVPNNLLDLALLLEVGERLPCEGAVDLQSVDEGGDGDEAVGLDILLELVGGGLVEDDRVVGLVLDWKSEVSSACFIRSLGSCLRFRSCSE